MTPENSRRRTEPGRLRVAELDTFFIARQGDEGIGARFELQAPGVLRGPRDRGSQFAPLQDRIGHRLILSSEFGGALTCGTGPSKPHPRGRKRRRSGKTLMNRYLWNSAQGMFFDYDYARETRRRT